MIKVFLRTVMILLVAGLVAGGIYLAVEKGGMSVAGGAGPAGVSRGAPTGTGFTQGTQPGSGQAQFRDGGPEGQAGFSLAGLSGVGMQAIKVAIVTTLVVAVKGIIGAFSQKDEASAAAA